MRPSAYRIESNVLLTEIVPASTTRQHDPQQEGCSLLASSEHLQAAWHALSAYEAADNPGWVATPANQGDTNTVTSLPVTSHEQQVCSQITPRFIGLYLPPEGKVAKK